MTIMKSLERRFKNISTRNTGWSSYVCFAEAVRGQNFSRRVLLVWFNKLVDKNDYSQDEKKQLLVHLECLNKPNEARTK